MFDASKIQAQAKKMHDGADELCEILRKKSNRPGNKIFIYSHKDNERSSMMKTLIESNYRVVDGNSSKQVVEKLSKNDIGLFIIDWEISKHEGTDLIEKLAECQMPIIYVSSKEKPIDPKELLGNVLINFGMPRNKFGQRLKRKVS